MLSEEPAKVVGGVQTGLRSAQRANTLPGVLSGLPPLFLIIVVLPTALAAIYYFFVAAPLYVSEAKFVVHTRNQAQTMGLGTMLASAGVSLGEQEEPEAYEVQSYMVSRDAVQRLIQNQNLRAVLDRPEGDFLFRYPRFFDGHTVEDLFQSYRRFVTVELDSRTEISSLKVRAFRPEDAQAVANALLDGGEDLVNRLNDRAMADAVAQAQRQVTDAQRHVIDTELALTAFRTRRQLMNPDQTSTESQELMANLEGKIDTMEADRASLAATAPGNPALKGLSDEIVQLRRQRDDELARLTGQVDSLAPDLGEYERLQLERELAAKTLEAAVGGLETAQLDARRQQLFLERVVNPGLPDKALEPRRLTIVFLVFVSSLVAYAIVSLVIAGLREHRQQ